jgi:hypothetical protein
MDNINNTIPINSIKRNIASEITNLDNKIRTIDDIHAHLYINQYRPNGPKLCGMLNYILPPLIFTQNNDISKYNNLNTQFNILKYNVKCLTHMQNFNDAKLYTYLINILENLSVFNDLKKIYESKNIDLYQNIKGYLDNYSLKTKDIIKNIVMHIILSKIEIYKSSNKNNNVIKIKDILKYYKIYISQLIYNAQPDHREYKKSLERITYTRVDLAYEKLNNADINIPYSIEDICSYFTKKKYDIQTDIKRRHDKIKTYCDNVSFVKIQNEIKMLGKEIKTKNFNNSPTHNSNGEYKTEISTNSLTHNNNGENKTYISNTDTNSEKENTYNLHIKILSMLDIVSICSNISKIIWGCEPSRVFHDINTYKYRIYSCVGIPETPVHPKNKNKKDNIDKTNNKNKDKFMFFVWEINLIDDTLIMYTIPQYEEHSIPIPTNINFIGNTFKYAYDTNNSRKYFSSNSINSPYNPEYNTTKGGSTKSKKLLIKKNTKKTSITKVFNKKIISNKTPISRKKIASNINRVSIKKLTPKKKVSVKKSALKKRIYVKKLTLKKKVFIKKSAKKIKKSTKKSAMKKKYN